MLKFIILKHVWNIIHPWWVHKVSESEVLGRNISWIIFQYLFVLGGLAWPGCFTTLLVSASLNSPWDRFIFPLQSSKTLMSDISECWSNCCLSSASSLNIVMDGAVTMPFITRPDQIRLSSLTNSGPAVALTFPKPRLALANQPQFP